MVKSELRRFLEDEFQSLAEPVSAALERAGQFRSNMSEPGLAVWAWPPLPDDLPPPPPGSAVERHLHQQLFKVIKPLLTLAERGFDCVPMVLNSDACHEGPPVGDHFQAAAMGGRITFPEGLPPEQRWGSTAWIEPLLNDISELGAFEQTDVSASPVLRAFLDMYEQVHEIVQGAVPNRLGFPDYGPLDVAGDIVGHEYLYELIGSDIPGAQRLLGACHKKSIEIRRQVEQAVDGKWVASKMWYGAPGVSGGAMIGRFISPDAHRQLVLHFHAKASKAYGGVAVSVEHQDSSLLSDVARIPGLVGARLPDTWPVAERAAALRGKAVLMTNAEDACAIAGQLRVLALIGAKGDTYQERFDSLLTQRETLERCWSNATTT